MKNKQNDKIYVPYYAQISNQLNKTKHLIIENIQSFGEEYINFDKLISLMNINHQLVVIHGKPGFGKTRFLQMILEAFIQFNNNINQKFKHAVINFQDNNAIEIKEILKNLIVLNKKTQQVEEAVTEELLFIILLDHFEEILMLQNFDEILNLLDILLKKKQISIILTINSESLDNNIILSWIAKYKNKMLIELMPFEEAQIFEFFKLFKARVLGELIFNFLNSKHESKNIEIKNWQKFQEQLDHHFFEKKIDFQIDETQSIIQSNLTNTTCCGIEQFLKKWNEQFPSSKDIKKMLTNYNLYELIQRPEALQIIATIIFDQPNQKNQYEFYEAMLTKLLQNLKKQSFIDSSIVENQLLKIQFESCSKLACNIALNQQNKEIQQQQYIDQIQPEIKFLMKHKEVLDFFIAHFFDEQINQISDISPSIQTHINDQKLTILLQTQKLNLKTLSELNFLQEAYKGVVRLLIEKNQKSSDIVIKLINIVKVSAKLEDFDQIAGNAMTILNKMKVKIKNEDFSHIRLSNTSMDDLQFLECNFNQSKMDNVRISKTQFISCSIEKVQWNNVQSSLLFDFSNNSIVEFSNTKSIIFVIDYVGLISIVNFYTSKVIKTFFTYGDDYPQLQLLCQGSVILLSPVKYGLSPNKEVISIFWNFKNNKKIRVCRGQENVREKFYFSKLRSKSSELIQRFNLDKNLIKEVIQTKNQKYFAFSVDQTIYIIDNKGQQLNEIKVNGEIKQKLFSPDDNRLVFIVDHKIFVWGIEEQQYTLVLNGHQDKILKISMFDQYLISMSEFNDELYREIYLWKIPSKNEIQELFFLSSVESITLSKDSNIIAQTCSNGKILFNRIDDGKEIQNITISEPCIQSISISPDWKKFASVNQKAQIFLWALEDGKKILQFQQVKEKGIKIIQFSPNGKYLACQPIQSEDDFMRLYIWNVSDGKLIKGVKIKKIVKYPFKFLQNSETIAILEEDCIALFDINEAKLKTISDSKSTQAIAFSANGQMLAYGCEFGTIVVIHIVNLVLIRMFGSIYLEEVICICFAPDNNLIVSGHLYGQIKIWSLKTGCVTTQQLQIPQKILDLSFSPDGQRLVTVFKNDTIYIWKVEYHNSEQSIHLSLQSNFGLSYFSVKNCLTKGSKFSSVEKIDITKIFQKEIEFFSKDLFLQDSKTYRYQESRSDSSSSNEGEENLDQNNGLNDNEDNNENENDNEDDSENENDNENENENEKEKENGNQIHE